MVTHDPFLTAPNTQAPTYINATAGTGGSIAPDGVVRVNFGGNQTFTITPNSGYHIADVSVNGTSVGVVNSYPVQNVSGATTISGTFAPDPTPTPTSTATPTPSPSPVPTPTASPTLLTPTPKPSAAPTQATVPATTTNGTIVNLAISGNITSSQLSNISFATNQSARTTILSVTVQGENGTIGFSNMTIAKSNVPYGTAPTVNIDNRRAENQGYTQDNTNYYIWYTTYFSTHHVIILFTASTPVPNPSSSSGSQDTVFLGLGWVQIGIIVFMSAVVAIVSVVAFRFLSQKRRVCKPRFDAGAATALK